MEDLSREEIQELFSTFKAELESQINFLANKLLELEHDPHQPDFREQLGHLMREAHNIKGAARIVDLPNIATLAQHIEDMLTSMSSDRSVITEKAFDLLHDSFKTMLLVVDEFVEGRELSIDSIIARFKNFASPAVPEGQTETDHRKSNSQIQFSTLEEELISPGEEEGKLQLGEAESSTKKGTPLVIEDKILISSKKLDKIMNLVGELLSARYRNEQQLDDLRLFLKSIESDFVDIEYLPDFLAHFSPTPQNMETLIAEAGKMYTSLSRSLNFLRTSVKIFTSDARNLSRLLDFLQIGIKQTRMIPMSTLFDTFPAMVRDIARQQEKRVNFILEGSDVELDKQIIENIRSPLVHLIRNAVDHGIEHPSERIKKGKEDIGSITLKAMQRESHITITIKDDGSGMNIESIKKKLLRAGIKNEGEIDALSSQELYQFVFLPGFSTRTAVTEISGRGYGLDIVRKNIETLHGDVSIDSQPGMGTTFNLRIPLSLATIRVLLVKINEELMGLPSLSIERVMAIGEKDLMTVEGKSVLDYNGQFIPLFWLSDTLGLPATQKKFTDDVKYYAILVSAQGQLGGFLVNDIIGEQDLVMKTIGESDTKIPCVSGAAVLSTGKIIILINPAEIFSFSTPHQIVVFQDAPEEEKATKRILIIDDSIITRNFEKAVLTASGYDVISASNGNEGLQILQREHVDVILSDIQMPIMDGLELAIQVKNDPLLSHIPLILLSSLDSQEDVFRGMEAGADAYIPKNKFSKNTIIETIERFI